MKIPSLRKVFLFVFTNALLIWFIPVDAQRSIVNKIKETTLLSPPDSIKWGSATAFDPDGQMVVVGSNIVSGHSNIVTTYYNTSGTQGWQETYSHNGMNNDFAIAVTVSNHIVYVLGASYDPISKFDYVLLKYNSSGALLYEARYNGYENKDDFPISMYIDVYGNAYLTGVSTHLTTGKDIATVKFNASGMQQWATVYDYNGRDDIATGVIANSNGNIFVTGGSSSSAYSRKYTVIKYNAHTGSQLAISRISNTASSLDIATSVQADNVSKIYTTGVMSHNGINFYTYTIKYDSLLNQVWADSFKGDSLYTEPRGLKMDASKCLYVGGYQKQHGGRNTYFLVKYDNSGNQKWERDYYGDYQKKDSAELIGFYVDDSANISVVGNVHNGTDRHIGLVYYDSSGAIQWEKIYSAIGSGLFANSVVKDGRGNVYITGVQKNATSLNYVTQKYHVVTYSDAIHYDITSQPLYLQHQLIINFHPSIVNTTTINNKDISYGVLSDFIDPTSIHAMDMQLGLIGDESMGNYLTKKIYKTLASTDTITISRTGDTLAMPKFWSHLVVSLPNGLDEVVAGDTLEKLSFIENAEPNNILQLASGPNDTKYSANQFSLHANSTYSNADINVEHAWDNYSTGNSNIVIGDYDSGIKWDHEDFGGSATSKIIGRDYVNNVSIQNSKDDNGHGTATAGIIGADRANNKGIAGIVGGNNTNGCALAAIRVTSGGADNLIAVSDLANAILDGMAPSTQTNGWGLNVMNCSWYSYSLFDDEIKRDFREAYKHDIIVVASMGNDGKNFASTTPALPAAFYDNWIIAVGASGIDGNFQDNQTNIGPNHLTGDPYKSNYGIGVVDLIAPGDGHLVYSTSNTSTSAYASFNKTSAAAAHVSGVAGLMLSYYSNFFNGNSSLSVDDVQYILKKTANTTNNAGIPDNKRGYGRLDAGSAMDSIKKSDFSIRHIERPLTATTPTATLVHSGVHRTLNSDVDNFSAGDYIVDVYKVTLTIPYTTTGHSTVLDCWPRNNKYDFTQTLLNDNGSEVGIEPGVKVESKNGSGAIVSGYLYQMKTFVRDNIDYTDQWLTLRAVTTSGGQNELNKINAAITIRTNEPQKTGIQKDVIPNLQHAIFPDPAHNQTTLQYILPNSLDVSIEITDIQGKVISSTNYGQQPAGEHDAILNMQMYNPGVYIARFQIGQFVYFDKFIKN